MWFSLSLVFFCPLLFCNRTFLFVNALSRYSQLLRYLVIASVAIVCFCATNRLFFSQITLGDAIRSSAKRVLPCSCPFSTFEVIYQRVSSQEFPKTFLGENLFTTSLRASSSFGRVARVHAKVTQERRRECFAARSRVLSRLVSLTILGELARRLVYTRSVLR